MFGFANDSELREQAAGLFARRNYSPEKAASGILRAIQKNRGVVPISPEARMGYWLKRLLPGAVGWLAKRTAMAQGTALK